MWASKAVVEAIQVELAAERRRPSYARKREADRQRREDRQAAYVDEFHQAVRTFLAFNGKYADLAERLAGAVTRHATPVGSGTVACTQCIPIERRAEAAVIAWLRHQSTAYDHMVIPRGKGKRREVRRMLAQRSKALLAAYRSGACIEPATCPLQQALHKGRNGSLPEEATGAQRAGL